MTLLAEELTTGNLIVNGTFDDGTNGWTISDQAVRINDCCPGGHDLEFGGSGGSIEQSFNLINNSITQTMLDQNPVTLNSSVEVQNGECGVAQCWGGSGPADPFTIRLQIRDENNNVLAVTTQERFNVTGINGKDFTDSVTYSGVGSNIGNIFISGSDSNNRYLGGPNLDNIVTTMTYNDEVELLSVAQTQELNTTFENIEEVIETRIEQVEFEPIEEIIFIPFEEPEILIETFEEISIQEITTEEINTGIINVFNLTAPGEITEVAEIEELEELPEISMEVQTYEEPQTIETFTAEVEGAEEITETEQTLNNETENETVEEIENAGGGNEPEPGTESNENSVAGNTRESAPESELVARNESETQTENSEQETAETEPEPGEGGRDAEDPEPRQTETDVASNETESADTDAVETSSQDQGGISIDIANVQDQVAKQIKSIDKQIVATQMIVAKVMQANNKMIDSYGSLNENIFNNQLEIDGGTLDDFYTRDYSDDRELYAEIQNSYSDSMAEYTRKVEEATANRIRAEEELKIIRGY